jgi:predicted amidophosphoribosyltransferase
VTLAAQNRHICVLNRDAWPGKVNAMTPRPLAEILALVAPPTCASCRAPLLEADRMVCAACVRELPWLRGSPCPRCALPRHGRRGGCPAAHAAFTAAWAPLAYDGVARRLVGALKFSAALPLAGVMAAHVVANLPAPLREVEAVVPVPPHRGRRRRRGYDPAGVLAVAVAERLGLPLMRCLSRGGGRRQVGAGRAQRRDPHRLAIELRRTPPQRVLLVDDVHTTGATLDACARALAAAGSGNVIAVSYARTL